MDGNKRNFELSLWDHKDRFLCLLKSPNSDFNGQSFNEDLVETVYGEQTLTFSLPLYIFNNKTQDFEKNERWNYILNEQKIRYIEYDLVLNTPKQIKEFVLKNFEETRSGEEKIVNCTCESLAIYELSKVGWGISFNVDYVSQYELEQNDENLLTLDYWLDKIFYWETNLGRVSNTTECTKMLQGLQMRNDLGEPIAAAYYTDSQGINSFSTIAEPICLSEDEQDYIDLYNPSGWHWDISALYTNNPAKISTTSKLYEKPTINQYIEITPNNYIGQSYQKLVGQNNDTKSLKRHPIAEEDYGKYEYVTDIKKRLYSVERSNVFSIIQDLDETFEVWAYFIYTYNNQGKIVDRKIVFKTEAINEEIKFDFAYGKNLSSCSRNVDSNELVTKLIVTDAESSVIEGDLLSIRQSSANPTGENYLYNFNYFYDLGSLSRLTQNEKNGIQVTDNKHSDEYWINLHCGQLKNLNNKISNLQAYLVPLYNRQMELQGDLVVKQGEINGYMDNIQSIQNKIDAISPEDRIIKSWSADPVNYNHVGETKTFSTTTYPGTLETCLYVKFNRDDVLYNQTGTVYSYFLNQEDDANSQTLDLKFHGIENKGLKYFNFLFW